MLFCQCAAGKTACFMQKAWFMQTMALMVNKTAIFINVSQMFREGGGGVSASEIRASQKTTCHVSLEEKSASNPFWWEAAYPQICLGCFVFHSQTVPGPRSEVEYSHHLVVWKHFCWHHSTWVLMLSVSLSPRKKKKKKASYLLEVKHTFYWGNSYSKQKRKRMFGWGGGGGRNTLTAI